jgi:predicted GTPase
MKRFVKTKFFLSLKESKNIQSSLLDGEYDEFVGLLFAGNTGMGKMEYHNALVYTGVELTSLTQVSEKKCSTVSSKSYWHC